MQTQDSPVFPEGVDLEGGGISPVQFEGTVDGNPAYFRARGIWWTFTIARPGDDPAWPRHPDGPLFERDGKYDPHGTGYGASYMGLSHARELILTAIAAFRTQDDG